MRSCPALRCKKALLLDMNGTFMFGEDRFSDAEDFSLYYFEIGGTLPKDRINNVVRATYQHLDMRYADENYRQDFPKLESAIHAVMHEALDCKELEKIVETFAFHELGHIPGEYAEGLRYLRRRFTLAAVIDIWSPKTLWLKEFERAGISKLFSATSFSSDHGMVKPSPNPFELVLEQLAIPKSEAMVVGDSPDRDLGGARRADVDCILVGGAEHPDAVQSFANLLELCDAI